MRRNTSDTTTSVWRAIGAGSLALALCSPATVDAQQTQTARQPQEQPVIQPADPPLPVTLDQLEENSETYLNKRVTVRAEVEDVLGPRLFKVDEQNWADLDPEVLVALPVPLAAMVKEEDRVTITGTVRPFTSVQLEREWGWIDMAPELEADIRARHVLVAESVAGWDDERLLTIRTEVEPIATGTTGTSGDTARTRTDESSAARITDVATLARATDNTLVGRDVKISATVARTNDNGGFWVESSGDRLYVLPANADRTVTEGQTVQIEGRVLRLPEHMEQRLEKSQKVGNEEIYLYATRLTAAGQQGR